MKKIFPVFIVSLALLVVACKPSRTEMLRNKYWKIKSLTQDTWLPLPNGDSTNNVLLFALPCVTDNHYMFSGDGNVYFNESAFWCDSVYPQEYVRGEWEFSDEETFLFFTDTLEDFEYIYTIEKFDSDYFRASYPRNDIVFTIEFVTSTP